MGPRVDRDVPVRSKDNGEGHVVRGGNGGKSRQYGCAGEDSMAVDRDNEGTNVFATDVANVRSRGAGGNRAKVTTAADVAGVDLETQSGMVAPNGLGDGVQAIEGVVGDGKVHRGQGRTIHSGCRAIRGQTAQRINVRWSRVKVVHTLVEAGVRGSFDQGAFNIVVIKNREGSRIAEEDAEAGVLNETAPTSGGRTHMNTAAEGSELGKIRLSAAAEHDGAGSPMTVGHDVVEADEVVERIRPKTGAQVGTGQHGTKGIADGLVWTFGRAVLAGGVGAGQLDLVTKVVEGHVNLAAFSKLTTTVHAHILIGAVGSIVRQPLVKPVHRGGFGSEGSAEDATAEVISE